MIHDRKHSMFVAVRFRETLPFHEARRRVQAVLEAAGITPMSIIRYKPPRERGTTEGDVDGNR